MKSKFQLKRKAISCDENQNQNKLYRNEYTYNNIQNNKYKDDKPNPNSKFKKIGKKYNLLPLSAYKDYFIKYTISQLFEKLKI